MSVGEDSATWSDLRMFLLFNLRPSDGFLLFAFFFLILNKFAILFVAKAQLVRNAVVGVYHCS